MKIVSWNVNSIRARQSRVYDWLERTRPDVVCLQETKVPDDRFPGDLFNDLGYRVSTHGQKSYNGVAILSSRQIEETQAGFGNDADEAGARLLATRIGSLWVYSCYVPNGQIVGSPAAESKLRWLESLKDLLQSRHSASEEFVVCGDFNIATDDRDVHDPDFWKMQVLYHSSMREALVAFTGDLLVDTFRLHHEEAEKYSWWDYRQLAFPKNRGLRIDYVFASSTLAARCSDAGIERDERKGKSPSDHAPVWAEFAF